MERNIQLEEKLVGEIEGQFRIPSYQRGYRWDENQVKALLNDIQESDGKPYCLQPIVVRKNEKEEYELIDGQQRLTTLFIIYKFMKTVWPTIEIKYTLSYETRSENTAFFDNLENESLANSNIDFYFIHAAYQTVKQWFQEKSPNSILYIVSHFLENFDKYVKVIWYELKDGDENEAIALFTRLNIGRIPLTNAELVRALFLCQTSQMSKEKQMEVSLQWDTLERELHDENFWYFLTKQKAETYPTRIELIFDFISGKKKDERDQFFTFLYFNARKSELVLLWENILRYYYRLKEWFKKDHLYHQVGYLVASGTTTIDALMNETKELKKSEMTEELDRQIKDSINCSKAYSELSYENDYYTISKILLLFNVVSLMKNGSKARFPFREFNTENWSLEHIHAQHSLKLNTQEKWKEWIGKHLESVRDREESSQLTEEMSKALANEHLTEAEFDQISDKVTNLLSESGDVEYVHSLSNMALLQCANNSKLNNALFDAKCRMIKRMDAEGKYIPYCTKMVFMKYYSAEKQDKINFYFWGEKDREAYIEKMNEVLKPYLKERISYGSERIS